MLQCPSQGNYGFFDDYKIPEHTYHDHGDYRGGSRFFGVNAGNWPSDWLEFGVGYNVKINMVYDKHRPSDFAKPFLTGIFAETGSFYWWNRYSIHGELGYWYADRHFEGQGNVLFMDGHVASVQTPYPNVNGGGQINIADPL